MRSHFSWAVFVGFLAYAGVNVNMPRQKRYFSPTKTVLFPELRPEIVAAVRLKRA
jgi:hypothetical protein